MGFACFAVGVCWSQVTWKVLNEQDTGVLVGVVLPEKAAMSHSICAEPVEQSGSRELPAQLSGRCHGDTRIRDTVYCSSWRLWRIHHVPQSFLDF